MEWISSLWNSPSVSESTLQTSGPIARQTLLDFFAKGKELFESPEFKTQLRLGHEQGKNIQNMVNRSQEKVFESLGIRGSLGISYLSRVRTDYANDAEMLRVFYEFVHLEERALDEAELPDQLFKSKYTAVDAIKEEIKAREAELEAMPPEQRHREVAAMFQKVVMSAQGADRPCCSHPGAGASAGHKLPAPMAPGEGGAAMSVEEQLQFFQSLSKS